MRLRRLSRTPGKSIRVEAPSPYYPATASSTAGVRNHKLLCASPCFSLYIPLPYSASKRNQESRLPALQSHLYSNLQPWQTGLVRARVPPTGPGLQTREVERDSKLLSSAPSVVAMTPTPRLQLGGVPFRETSQCRQLHSCGNEILS